MLEVCVDSLESAQNAINGGADELELCSSLLEGGLTPSPGLVQEVLKLVKNEHLEKSKVKVNVMIRCRSGSYFCYTEQDMQTMLSDVEVYKNFKVDRFVFGALTSAQNIDKRNCKHIIDKAYPIPVTFHRAFDLCKVPMESCQDIIDLGFDRLLTSGQQETADKDEALELLKSLLEKFNNKIVIMPGAGINCNNVNNFVKLDFKIVHSSCKSIQHLPNVGSLDMGSNQIYVTDTDIVRRMKEIMLS